MKLIKSDSKDVMLQKISISNNTVLLKNRKKIISLFSQKA